tara:strand:+ start:543 stop:1979 length:1437 start_codon:yes stop_codon:yes gene_type:complete
MGIGDKMVSGMAWSAVERLSIQIVQFIIGIVLARLLTPQEYGIIGILIVFIALSQVFIDSGFTKALIQKQNRTDQDTSTVFWFNIVISTFFYFILYFGAPYVSEFYKIELLSPLLRVLAISLIVNALYAVPATLFTIDMDFKSLTKINFISTMLSGGIAVYMAYTGYGVWALVIQTLVRSCLMAILMWFMVRWKPKFIFSKESFKQLFSFGSKLLISSLLSQIVNNFYNLFIAKFISTKDLGYYTRGTQFSDVTFTTINSILDRVLLPSLAPIQNQQIVLVKNTRSIIKASALLIVPIFLFLALLAKPIITVLLTEKWLPAVPIMQLFCLARMITIISGINVNILYVLGRTDLALKQQYVKIAIRVLFFILALKFGIIYIALAELLSTIVHFFINTYYPGKIMNYGARSQLKDIRLIFLSGCIMVLFTFFSIFYIDNVILKLIVAPIVAIVIYIGSILILKVPEFNLIVERAKKLFIK